MQKLLSVVIPVYKVEQYINKCLSSLLIYREGTKELDSERMSLLDIVVINDGTPDNSAEMAREFEKQYPDYYRVIDQENRGHGGAWNHGTELATGKYLFYLDSDDWFDTSELAKLIDYLGHCDTDMVMIDGKNYHAVSDSYSEKNRHRGLEPDRIYNADEFDWIGSGHGYELTYAHDTVYRTSMMQQYMPLYCEHVMYDDVSLQTVPVAIANDFIYTHINVYRYFIGRPGQSFDPKVRAVRGADDVTKVLKFNLDWVCRNRQFVPKGGMREAYTEDNYQSMGTWHYYELALFDIPTAAPRLKEWDDCMRACYPDIRPDWKVRLYRTTPVWIFVPYMKFWKFYRRVINRFKRKF